ncbi:simple sugar transport system permease protein [Chromobacterium alkanivorans]|uniref:ABC transporter permease n=1 Tax=Chromobacterium TaxID=535 RepID=UPI000653F33A|nr:MULTISPECIES: ABC transporter permease [Chromobacterium]KMN83889.1 sugar ABC transporter permease [Chromobacterium sp. LK11]MBN3005844.1 ABC transporter permease [Chromobacterium alkanivorans]MCS3806427.1 simple sugar transport system permease protein [Chromobacterium alkanivorans]MCS3820878.1 simple sugar transport system permease protein [Chromobacterium alkanivorans]MCS3875800.1 simple sugar transport system permease protein [Chromobacterium alkanivorans]
MEIFFSLLDSTLRVATPLILAAMAGMFSERSGVVDISLEGKMLVAAFAAAAGAFATQNPWIGMACGIAASVAMAMIHAFVSVTYNGNQLISGMALNTVASGITPVLGLAWFQQGGNTPQLPDEGRFHEIALPFANELRDVPLLGQLYSKLLSGHSILVYLTLFLIVPLVAWVLYKSRFGLRLRAVGENPHAADTAGISVAKVRYTALFWGGVLCGIAGTYLSVYQTGSFIKEMTAGKGFLALAALIFGKWKPLPAVLGCLVFAFADAIQIRLEGVALPGIGQIPSQAIAVIPYVLTVLLLAGFVGRAVAPKAIGIPFVKSR